LGNLAAEKQKETEKEKEKEKEKGAARAWQNDRGGLARLWQVCWYKSTCALVQKYLLTVLPRVAGGATDSHFFIFLRVAVLAYRAPTRGRRTRGN
jgi:hypothetical protein